GAREKTNPRLSGAFSAWEKSGHQNVQRLALRRKRRSAQGRSQIQAQRPWPRPQAPHKIDIAPSPALRIFFAPDFPALHESGRKISWPGLDPIIDNRRRKKPAGFNLASVELKCAFVRSAVKPDEFVAGSFGRGQLSHLF